MCLDMCIVYGQVSRRVYGHVQRHVCRHVCGHMCRHVYRNMCGHAQKYLYRRFIDMCVDLGADMHTQPHTNGRPTRHCLSYRGPRCAYRHVDRHVYRHVYRHVFGYVYRLVYTHVCRQLG